jgi:hypothetical protein
MLAVDNGALFPDICAKSAKWFHSTAELFLQLDATKHWREKLNDFSGGSAGTPVRQTAASPPAKKRFTVPTTSIDTGEHRLAPGDRCADGREFLIFGR